MVGTGRTAHILNTGLHKIDTGVQTLRKRGGNYNGHNILACWPTSCVEIISDHFALTFGAGKVYLGAYCKKPKYCSNLLRDIS